MEGGASSVPVTQSALHEEGPVLMSPAPRSKRFFHSEIKRLLREQSYSEHACKNCFNFLNTSRLGNHYLIEHIMENGLAAAGGGGRRRAGGWLVVVALTEVCVLLPRP